MVLGAVVVERQCQDLVVILACTILHGMIESVDEPLQTAGCYQIASRLRRSQRVTVLILYLIQGHIDVAMVQLGSSLVELYHHLVTSADEAVLQVSHLLVRQYRSSLCLIDVAHDDILAIRKLIPASRSLCRLLGLGIKFIDDVTIGITLYYLTIYIRYHFDGVVRLQFLTVEAQISLQTSLITVRALLRVGVDERLRQGLSEEAELVDITLQRSCAVVSVLVDHIAACTDERIATADTTQCIGLEGSAYLLVYVDVSHVASTVHGHRIVVPLVVAPVARYLDSEAVRTVHQLLSLESDVELVLRTVVLLQTTAVREQRTATLGIGLEPEHQRVVLFASSIQGAALQLQALVFLVQVQ